MQALADSEMLLAAGGGLLFRLTSYSLNSITLEESPPCCPLVHLCASYFLFGMVLLVWNGVTQSAQNISIHVISSIFIVQYQWLVFNGCGLQKMGNYVGSKICMQDYVRIKSWICP